MKSAKQMTFFDVMDDKPLMELNNEKKNSKDFIKFEDSTLEKLNNYKLEDYVHDVENIGLEKTWDRICQYVTNYRDKATRFLDVKNFGELYEIGLAIQDKILKKKNGQYYTPDDVANVMAKWLKDCEGTAVCDVACGTGKLILTYLEIIGYDAARELISKGNLYLYDFDKVALKICKATIAIKYGLDIANSIHDIFCDFLNKSIILPDDAKVISNPPYAKINEIQDYWIHTEVLKDTKELYSCFMEKIFDQAKSTVIITPFSFISGTKFESLRKLMCSDGGGFIVAFDNVPGNIFCGRKHGIFNTNTANSVRAAITVVDSNLKNCGFRISPLIRFKNEERKRLLKCDVLEKTLPPNKQIISKKNTVFKKIDSDLYDVYEKWTLGSKYKLRDFVVKTETDYVIDMPNTCRYFTVGCSRKLKRTGSIILNIDNENIFYFLYCFINSSFTYWWWRIFDGGITYPISLLNELPIPFNLLTDSDKHYFNNLAKEMISKENSFIVKKMNAGVAQENIKFPEQYRERINQRLLKIIGYENEKKDVFKRIHDNKFF